MRYLLDVVGEEKSFELKYETCDNSLVGAGAVPAYITKCEENKKLRINIVMGSKCNYNCGYCCQSNMKDEIFSPLNMDMFIKSLHEYCDKHYSNFESAHILFWGGEPLVYLDMMKRLAGGLKDIKPHTMMGICSNGALLNESNFKWLCDNNIGVGFSYDGPGQYARHNTDVLEKGSFALEALKEGIKNYGWSVNPVFHRGNPLISQFVTFMDDRLETEAWNIGDVQMLMVTDEHSKAWILTENEMYDFSIDCCQEIFSGRAQRFVHTYYNAASNFLKNLGVSGMFGGCQNSQEEGSSSLNVDVSGNVWACHSYAGQNTDELGGDLWYGNLRGSRRKIRLSALNFRRERMCKDCALRMFCGGGCIGTPIVYDDINCQLQWHKWFPGLSLAVNMLTGGQLVKIKRDGAE